MDTWTLTVKKKKKKYFLKFRGSSLLWSHCILEAQITSGCQISTYALTVNSRLVHYSMVDTCMVCRAQTRTLPFQILHVFYSLWASCIAVSECFVSCNNQPVSISSAVWLIDWKEGNWLQWAELSFFPLDDRKPWIRRILAEKKIGLQHHFLACAKQGKSGWLCFRCFFINETHWWVF